MNKVISEIDLYYEENRNDFLGWSSDQKVLLEMLSSFLSSDHSQKEQALWWSGASWSRQKKQLVQRTCGGNKKCSRKRNVQGECDGVNVNKGERDVKSD